MRRVVAGGDDRARARVSDIAPQTKVPGSSAGPPKTQASQPFCGRDPGGQLGECPWKKIGYRERLQSSACWCRLPGQDAVQIGNQAAGRPVDVVEIHRVGSDARELGRLVRRWPGLVRLWSRFGRSSVREARRCRRREFCKSDRSIPTRRRFDQLVNRARIKIGRGAGQERRMFFRAESRSWPEATAASSSESSEPIGGHVQATLRQEEGLQAMRAIRPAGLE